MTEASVTHATIVLERTYDASSARVFKALADPQARMRWGTPSKHVELIYDKADFRVGGLDVSRCGPRGKLIYRVETRYLDIEPEHRIVSTETVSEGWNRLSVSLITVELKAQGKSTRLILTDQVAAFGDKDMIAGSEAGFSAALDNLAAEFSSEPANA
ncbi:SRPBCC family protein [Mesorhizobium sp. PAMC28654]|uniref:SRPBCC family protein n=1 Tax=Mesorhizobium sp. PAMC28654 TaxID=2880934 RepID=UPI001D09FEEE|nr:SRPBCC family protein [Mesorhizobium sp. PAMC28654]UDL87933.1 SRPBCC family protein [Mesorhizobium sp. PAMC28654]